MTDDSQHLAVNDISKRFQGIQALDGVSFSVERNSITAIIGPNGAGKSTLFEVLSGFQKPDQGEAKFEEKAILGLPAYKIAQRGLVRTFQVARALAKLTVLENVCLATSGHPGERVNGVFLRPAVSRACERTARERARELLDGVGLEHVKDQYAGTLSGGQRKLLELARALMTVPRMLLLDEPLAGVNPSLRQEILRHIQAARRTHNLTVLFVEHDMGAVMSISDRIVVMDRGQVIAIGRPSEIRSNDRVIEAYLGSERR